MVSTGQTGRRRKRGRGYLRVLSLLVHDAGVRTTCKKCLHNLSVAKAGGVMQGGVSVEVDGVDVKLVVVDEQGHEVVVAPEGCLV